MLISKGVINMNCPDVKKLSLYLDGALAGVERDAVERHLSICDKCLDIVVLAYEAQRRSRKCPEFIRDRVKLRLGLRNRKAGRELRWLVAALVLFALSFLVRKYFAQFLTAAAVMGFKWVMEGEGARRAIMVFRGIGQNEKKIERKSHPPLSNIMGGDRYGEGE